MDKKGQAAMEFLMTYGWAILAAIVAIGALAYLGVFSPGKLVQDAVTVSTPFMVKAAVINPASVQIELAQNLGETLNITSIEVSGCGNLTVGANLATSNTALYTINCSSALASGDSFKGDLTIVYNKQGSTLSLQSAGTITGKVRISNSNDNIIPSSNNQTNSSSQSNNLSNSSNNTTTSSNNTSNNTTGSCVDECLPEWVGDQFCFDRTGIYRGGVAGHRTCGNYDSDSCRDWSPMTLCAQGEACFVTAHAGSPGVNISAVRACKQLTNSCTDNDSGINYSVKGTATGQDDITGNTTTATDYCQDSGRLREFRCYYNSDYNSTFLDRGDVVTCLNGCSDGACRPENYTVVNSCSEVITDYNNCTSYCRQRGYDDVSEFYLNRRCSCVDNDVNGKRLLSCDNTKTFQGCDDTDGGKNYSIRGETRFKCVGCDSYEFAYDSCNVNTLTELYCDSNTSTWKSETVTCVNGCGVASYQGSCSGGVVSL